MDEKEAELFKHALSLLPQNKDARELESRITTIETELPHIVEDITELKQQKKEEPKAIEAAKDKRFSRSFAIFGAFCGIMSLLLNAIKFITDLLKKP